MSGHRFSRRYFFYGTLLTGAVPAGGFGSTQSLSALGYKSPNVKKYKDYRKMFEAEGKSLDAVMIATPDHMLHLSRCSRCSTASMSIF